MNKWMQKQKAQSHSSMQIDGRQQIVTQYANITITGQFLNVNSFQSSISLKVKIKTSTFWLESFVKNKNKYIFLIYTYIFLINTHFKR